MGVPQKQNLLSEQEQVSFPVAVPFIIFMIFIFEHHDLLVASSTPLLLSSTLFALPLCFVIYIPS